jgi:hypothetical protein
MAHRDDDALASRRADPTPTRSAPDDGDGALGSRGHLRVTLERVHAAIAAIAASSAGGLRSRSLLASAEPLAAESGRLVRASQSLREQLRASVGAYARRLRTDGVPSERMLVLVKSAVRDATPRELDAIEARELMDEVVRWSIEAYYAA